MIQVIQLPTFDNDKGLERVKNIETKQSGWPSFEKACPFSGVDKGLLSNLTKQFQGLWLLGRVAGRQVTLQSYLSIYGL